MDRHYEFISGDASIVFPKYRVKTSEMQGGWGTFVAIIVVMLQESDFFGCLHLVEQHNISARYTPFTNV